ncbi:hypothetical protein B0H16DRAFT_1700177 [Mycena metata]|uniref:Uncharacterized protein n=1 Tax=Mycena metata TaxID=1033252 RepID=A0AAD7HFR2_9AGAR|nr:hypothetical protein B0H16DRAFT_1700177 [Mycena metata]
MYGNRDWTAQVLITGRSMDRDKRPNFDIHCSRTPDTMVTNVEEARRPRPADMGSWARRAAPGAGAGVMAEEREATCGRWWCQERRPREEEEATGGSMGGEDEHDCVRRGVSTPGVEAAGQETIGEGAQPAGRPRELRHERGTRWPDSVHGLCGGGGCRGHLRETKDVEENSKPLTGAPRDARTHNPYPCRVCIRYRACSQVHAYQDGEGRGGGAEGSTESWRPRPRIAQFKTPYVSSVSVVPPSSSAGGAEDAEAARVKFLPTPVGPKLGQTDLEDSMRSRGVISPRKQAKVLSHARPGLRAECQRSG